MESTAQHTSGEEIDWKMACCRLPSIPHGADHGVQGYDEKLGSQVPRLWEEGDHGKGGELLCRCCFLVYSYVVLVSYFHCIVLFFFFATIFIAIEI